MKKKIISSLSLALFLLASVNISYSAPCMSTLDESWCCYNDICWFNYYDLGSPDDCLEND